MMVFFKERLAVLSVPKTGTTAYEAVLRERADMIISEPAELKHAPVYRYNRFLRPMFLQVCDVELELMAVMREPISWLGSWWRYRQRDFLKGRPTSTLGVSFDAFVEAYMKGKRPPFANVGSQAKFLRAQQNGVAVSHLFRYEDQTGIQSFLEDRLKTSIVGSIEQKNVSPKHPVVLSASVEERLRRKCAEEFAVYDGIAAIR